MQLIQITLKVGIDVCV